MLSLWVDRPVLMIDLESIKMALSAKRTRTPGHGPGSEDGSQQPRLREGGYLRTLLRHAAGEPVVNYTPEIIGTNLVLIDPVCLLLTLPDVAYNFLYKPPVTVMEWMIS